MKKAELFVGRDEELRAFEELKDAPGPKIMVVYGRRRIGKTTLIHRSFQNRGLLKFEGLEGKSPSVQRAHFLEQMARYFSEPNLAKLRLSSWREVLIELARCISGGGLSAGHIPRNRAITLYFEEIQWMASYKEDLIVDLKYVWDNYLQKQRGLILILCGSAPSFLVEKVLMSKALYNRSQYTFPLGELSLSEVKQLMGPKVSKEGALDAYLTVGGVPEYIKYLTSDSSTYLSICRHSFINGGFFVDEADRIFVSSLSKNSYYRSIVRHLAKDGPKTKSQILDQLKIPSGGASSRLFLDLKQCGFIGSYSSLDFGDDGKDSRMFLSDPYLQFYYTFIYPKIKDINAKRFDKESSQALPIHRYRQWLGYSFERFCLNHANHLAGILGFSAVQYSYGPFYSKKEGEGLQIDLAFKRADQVLTICECKYGREPIGKEVVRDFERKVGLISKAYKRFSIHRVLISPHGTTAALRGDGYFDRIIEMDHLI